ncbi:type II toxin-antitoxin system VapC family toxin [Parapedobacter tibetensis]|uniref:type II toxin-antitoxin system VapC family toxin n=1 Tax=Parapedobacter tibetensis TaxID=2972951 RepID=UPI00214D5749|nr:type II toxin-antitoxin system VapC family toxin [Parapedobacter tibetensis]
MRHLLDSHTFLWALLDRKKLSAEVIRILEDTNHEIYISAISFWEISLKYRLGKLDLTGVNPDELPPLAKESGFTFLALEPSEASGYHRLEADWHRDPFDRMLIWQAINHDLVLLSKDETISQYRSVGLKQLW